MTIGRKLHTTRCHKPVSVGDAWLSIEHIYKDEDGRGAVVAYRDPSKPSPYGPRALRGGCIPLGERRELFPGVHVTIDRKSVHSSVKLVIEADRSVPITDGFPHQRKLQLAPAGA